MTANLVMSPVELHQLFTKAGASELSDQVAWHNPGDPLHTDPDRNAFRNGFLARKVLRLFRRDPGQAETYREFVRRVPVELSEEIETAAREAITRLGAT